MMRRDDNSQIANVKKVTATNYSEAFKLLSSIRLNSVFIRIFIMRRVYSTVFLLVLSFFVYVEVIFVKPTNHW